MKSPTPVNLKKPMCKQISFNVLTWVKMRVMFVPFLQTESCFKEYRWRYIVSPGSHKVIIITCALLPKAGVVVSAAPSSV